MSTTTLKKGDTRLCLILTRVNKLEGYGDNYCHNVKLQPLSFIDGDVIHFLHIDCVTSRTVRFTAISLSSHPSKNQFNRFLKFDLYKVGLYNNALTSYDITDMVHYYGYGKMLGLRANDQKLNFVSMTNHTFGLHYKDWSCIFKTLNHIRDNRISRRFIKTREYGEDLDEDLLDMVLSKVVKRVNAIINGQLHNGYSKDEAYLKFHTGKHAFPI
jgi:hypothetical protein